MARVFLSYDHEDEEHAMSIMSALEKAGHSVWWDRHISGGAQYNSEIENAVSNADAVVVLWSERSVQSAWVRDEAAEGRDGGKLVPVKLDNAKPPMGFRQFQTIDFSRTGRGKRAGKLNELFAAVEKLGQAATKKLPVAGPATLQPAPRLVRRPVAVATALAVVLVMAAVAFIFIRSTGGASVQSVAVVAVDPTARPLARDLVVNLATLRSARSGSMRLIDDEKTGRRADLIFEVGGDLRSGKPNASLVLMTGEDRTILWSEDFQQKAGGADILKQQVGFTAARVLGCGLEALSPKKGPLRQDQLKLYLTGCATLDENFFSDTSQATTMFTSLTMKILRRLRHVTTDSN